MIIEWRNKPQRHTIWTCALNLVGLEIISVKMGLAGMGQSQQTGSTDQKLHVGFFLKLSTAPRKCILIEQRLVFIQHQLTSATEFLILKMWQQNATGVISVKWARLGRKINGLGVWYELFWLVHRYAGSNHKANITRNIQTAKETVKRRFGTADFDVS